MRPCFDSQSTTQGPDSDVHRNRLYNLMSTLAGMTGLLAAGHVP